MLTELLFDETPDIFSDNKNFLLVFQTEVFHGKEKKNGVYVSVSPQQRHQIRWCLIRRPVTCYREKVGYAKPLTKVGQTAVSKIVSHTSTRSSYNSLPLNAKRLLFQIHDTIIDDGSEAGSQFCFIRPYDDDGVDE